MTEFNQIFEAVSSIDDDIAANAIKTEERSKRKKPITLLTITAAAAIMSLIVGFASQGGAYDKFAITFETNNSPKRGFKTTITEHKFTIPEEIEPLRNKRDNSFFCFVDMLPSELIERFGLPMLTSDNFSDTKDIDKIRNARSNNGPILQGTWEPFLEGNDTYMTFYYYQYEKNIDTNIEVEAIYIADMDRYILEGLGEYHLADEEVDIVKLKDGSLAMVSDTYAAFCYYGIGYKLKFDDYYDENIANIDNMKQVLADLGVFDPSVSE